MEFSPLKALSRPTSAANFQSLSRATSHFISSSRENSLSAGSVRRDSRVQQGSGRVQRVVKKSSSRSNRSSGRVLAMARSVELKKGVELKVYEKSGELGEDLAAYVAGLSESAIREKGSFSVVLSGGSLISTLG